MKNNQNNIVTGENLRVYTSTAGQRKNNLRIHYHTHIELSLVLDGEGRYKIGNNYVNIEKGDLFFFRPNEAHCITDIINGDMKLLNIQIAPYFLYTNFQNALNSNYIKFLASSYPISTNKISENLNSETTKQITALMNEIKSEYDKQNSDYLTLICSHLTAILILISRSYKNTSFSKTEKQNYQKMLKAIEFIDKNYKDDISLDYLAKKVAYSKCYLSSIFKKCMGMSVWDYITIKRIEEALSLIKTTDKTMVEIALECGFNTTVNFNKLFKKYTNVTPSYFRK